MSSLVSIRLYNDDGTPKVLAIPKLSAILEKDNTLVLDSVDMIEVGEGFYKYVFIDYIRTETYFFFIDGEQYDNINQLDSYGNKGSRGTGGLIINYEQLAKDIWDFKEKDANKGSIAEYIFNLKNYSSEEIETKINEMFIGIFNKSDELSKSITEAINGIKIPKQLNMVEIIKPIEDILNNSIKAYSDSIKEGLDALNNALIENISTIEKYDDSEIINEVKNIIDGIDGLKSMLEGLNDIEVKVNDNKETSKLIDNSIKEFNNQLVEINRKLSIAFTRLNK